MKTKGLLLALVMSTVLGGSSIMAQPRGGELQKMRQHKMSENRIEKRVESMQKRLLLDDEKAKKFATIYAEYLTAMKETVGQRPSKKEVANNTDEQIMKDLKSQIANEQKRADLKAKYFDKLQKVLTPRQLKVVFGHKNKFPKAKSLKGRMGMPSHAMMGRMHKAKGDANCKDCDMTMGNDSMPMPMHHPHKMIEKK